MRLLVPVAAFALIAAACGDDKESSDTTAAPATTAGAATTAAPATTAASAETTAAAPETTAATPETTAGGTETTAAAGGACTPDDSLDATEGINAGKFIADLNCSLETPLAAGDETVIIGVQNPEGDPNGSFPEYSAAIQAAADYINAELGGLGGDPVNGIPGKKIQIELCTMNINPADSQACANELSGKDPFTVISTLNFFGNHFPIYAQAGVSVVVGTPITVGDFTDTSTFSIGGGGGCLGVHTGLVYAATQTGDGFLGKSKIAVPWADTPPGVVCYYDLEQKPLQVLKGEVASTSALAGSNPNIEYIPDGVPIAPASADLTGQAATILGFSPEAILFSAQGADCWNLVAALGAQGWTPDAIPLLLSGACIDFEKMTQAGDLAKGIYFVGASGAQLAPPDTIDNPRMKVEAVNYQTKAAEYGLDAANIKKGFAAQGWAVMMTIWEQAQLAAKGDIANLTPDSFKAQMASTSGNHIFSSTPFGCADAVEPYVAVCNSHVSLSQWDGSALVTINGDFNGTDLIAGTEIIPGPS